MGIGGTCNGNVESHSYTSLTKSDIIFFVMWLWLHERFQW